MPPVAVELLDHWMTRSVAGDQEAFTRLVEATQHLVRAVLLKDTASLDLADEIAQEVFVQAWCKRSQYRPGTNPRAWLLAIARNRLVQHHRREGRRQRHLPSLIRRELLRRTQMEDRQPATSDRLRALQTCLRELEPEQRRLLDLVHADGLSTADTAAALGVQPATCRQRLSRLQRALRRCMLQRLESA